MFHETVLHEDDILITHYNIKVFNKNNGKIIINRYIVKLDEALKNFNNLRDIYHKMDGRYRITLYDTDKCSFIEEYDPDDNI